MILQALHADKRLKELGKQGRIIMKTSDTDVIVLYIYFYKQMTNTSLSGSPKFPKSWKSGAAISVFCTLTFCQFQRRKR
jgi:hypothetical protein